jgi:hypothetical protein
MPNDSRIGSLRCRVITVHNTCREAGHGSGIGGIGGITVQAHFENECEKNQQQGNVANIQGDQQKIGKATYSDLTI